MPNPLSSLPSAAQDVLKRAGLTLIHAFAAIALVAYQRHVAGQTVSLSAYSSAIIAGVAAALSILWHGLPALLGAAKAKRLQRQLTAVAALETQIRAQIANPAPQAPPVP